MNVWVAALIAFTLGVSVGVLVMAVLQMARPMPQPPQLTEEKPNE